MRQSLVLMEQCINRIPEGPVKFVDSKLTSPSRGEAKSTMEGLIAHFKYFTQGPAIVATEAYAAVEAPKGEFGVAVTSDGSNKPYRCKLKAPGFLHLNSAKLFARRTIG